MAPSPSKRHTIATTVNPLLSNLSMLSLDHQLAPPSTATSRPKKPSNPSPLKGSKSSSSLRTQHKAQASSAAAALSNSVHKAFSRPINRDDLLGRDLVRKDWGSSSSSSTSPSKKTTSRKVRLSANEPSLLIPTHLHTYTQTPTYTYTTV
ncbi:hypothetical protein PTTG_03216 [Puccinia triticina 1-1 BBBD Race 1]|uniref:Uncharacterized protein n=1 Tax=Puccinia triticina (isolate 1-1 / race 1 (BBBD)) TaxID=630390 RepID=A0A0C4ER05_PUCT1|nr:hypothetical protein PTTG_03216 [Puccinia triticina 1-1 BBBD Race 1]